MGDQVVSVNQAPVADEDQTEAGSKIPSYAASLWAVLIARIYEVLPLVCTQCGGELKIVAFLTEAAPIQRILNHIGELATPPRIEPACAPPDWLDGIVIKRPRMNRKQRNPYRNLSLIRP